MSYNPYWSKDSGGHRHDVYVSDGTDNLKVDIGRYAGQTYERVFEELMSEIEMLKRRVDELEADKILLQEDV